MSTVDAMSSGMKQWRVTTNGRRSPSMLWHALLRDNIAATAAAAADGGGVYVGAAVTWVD